MAEDFEFDPKHIPGDLITEPQEFTIILAEIWNDLEAKLGEEWYSFRNCLWSLLRRLEAEVEIEGKREIVKRILSLFQEYPKASLLLQRSHHYRRSEYIPEPPDYGEEKEKEFELYQSVAPEDHPTRTVIVPIMYATDRAISGRNKPSKFYKADRGDGQLSYGVAEVSVPDDHRMGELETPSIFKLQFRPDPEKHVVLLTVDKQNKSKFVKNARERLARSNKNEVLVFLHGFNVTFEDAARRTAQIAYDLQFKGVPVLYSWPSEGKKRAYTVDEANVIWTRPHFNSFINFIINSLDTEAVHIIGHSMGNRVLAEMIDDFDPDQLPAGAANLRQIVFAAPDIDAQTFQELADEFHGRAERFTMYTSSKDLALKLSGKVHKYRRAGDKRFISDTVDTIDASMVDTSFLGHSYFGDNRNVISDLFYVINHGTPPEERHGLECVPVGKSQYWRFRP